MNTLDEDSATTSADRLQAAVPHLRLLPDLAETTVVSLPKPAARSTLASIAQLLREHPEWEGVLAWDDFAKRVHFRAPPPPLVGMTDGRELNDNILSRMRLWFEDDLGLQVKKDLLLEAVRLVAYENPFHPVREYLASLTCVDELEEARRNERAGSGGVAA